MEAQPALFLRRILSLFLFLLISGVLFFAGRLCPPAWGAQQVSFVVGENGYTVDGQKKESDAPPFIAKDRVYVPVRYLALSLGVGPKDILWDDTAAAATLSMSGVTVKMTVGSYKMAVNGEERTLDVPSLLKEGRVYLPARYVAEAFGYQVGWDGNARTVLLSAPEFSPVSGKAEVKEAVVNVRSGPGTNCAVVTRVSQGEKLSLLGKAKEKDWYLVALSGGGRGWVASWLLKDPVPQEKPSPGNRGGGAPGSGTPDPDPGPAPIPAPEPGGGSGGGETGTKPGQPGGGPGSGTEGGTSAGRLKVEKAGETTRLTIALPAGVTYNAFTLRSPDRLVIDLTGLRPDGLPASLAVDTPQIKSVRVGFFSRNPDVTRVVCDLKQPATYQAELSADKKTLTVILPGSSGPAGKKPALSEATIVIDPGHGGRDVGAIGPTGFQEKTANLNVALKVAELLRQKGARVILTRSGDTEPSLEERTGLANRERAHLFVSIHMNAFTDPGIGGTTTYYLSSEGVERAVQDKKAPRQQEESRRLESSKLASCVQSALVKSLGLESKGVREANFAVLRTSQMPAILIETAFISNPDEEKMMKTARFAENAARGIVEGVAAYLAAN
ncbi:MAG: N-acetylmuramoyl-L-alanine amidase [Desulfotomaculales bacterium]